jgi:hypothetical protein
LRLVGELVLGVGVEALDLLADTSEEIRGGLLIWKVTHAVGAIVNAALHIHQWILVLAGK